MKKARNRAVVILLLLCAAVLLWAFLPRSLYRAIRASRGEIVSISALVEPAAFPNGGHYTLLLTPEDPAFDQLLDLLGSKKYLPMMPGNRSRQLLLDDSVYINFLVTVEEDTYWAPGLYLTGDAPIQIEQRDYSVSGSERFQQSVLDLLLEQGYDPAYGARPMKRLIQSKLETLCARAMIAGTVHDGKITIDAREGEFVIA